MTSSFAVGHHILENTEKSLKMEWLETNGLGAYASSTILDCHTRKYHGYFVSPIPEHTGRHVLLSKVDAVVLSDDHQFALGTNKYPGVYHPTGHRYAESFEYAKYPRTLYQIGDLTIEKSFIMPYGRNTVIIKYALLDGGKSITLQLFPYLAYRHFHSLAKENTFLQVKVFSLNAEWKIEPYAGMPPLYFRQDGRLKFYPGPDWLLNFEYLKEMKRGYDFREDLFCPGMFEAKLRPGLSVYLQASLDANEGSPKELWEQEIARRDTLIASLQEDAQTTKPLKKKSSGPIVPNTALELLKYNARHFLIQAHGNRGAGLIAGYPWFGEWGRDAMIALPGLTLHQGNKDVFLAVMRAFSKEAKDGLLPNERGADHSQPSYNSVDAGFWYFWALQYYVRTTSDGKTVQKEFAKTMKDILMVYEKNQSPHGYVNEDGLLSLGAANTQLTWMDAQTVDGPVTPRNGFAVEINALWFNAISFYQEMKPADFKKNFPNLQKYLNTIPKAFLKMFWLPDLGYLADVVTDGVPDISVRPNQVIATAMPYCLLDTEQIKQLLSVIDRELLTPYGLRTLSPKNVKYRGYYKGDQKERDSSYHQGCVWPWLIGVYVDSFLKLNERAIKEKKHLLEKLHPLLESVREGGLGSIGEIREGDAPHITRGCPAQAWSVAETIRAIELLESNGKK